MSEYSLSVTLKGGKDFDAPWIVVYANTPDEAEAKLRAVSEGNLAEATVLAANALKAINNAAPLLPGGPAASAPPQQQSAPPANNGGWGQPQQQQAPPPQQNQGGSKFGGPPHPEGKACHCGNVLEMKKTGTGKQVWRCSEWRWQNGNPNDHASEWVN